MKVLQLASYYTVSAVFVNLFEKLSENVTIQQEVFVPIRDSKEIGVNSSDKVSVKYALFLNTFLRFFFRTKINVAYRELKKEFNLNDFHVIHAHTLFSDGALAYKIYREFNIPYIITVRNTDINIFLKYFLHLRPLAEDILENATYCIFTNYDYSNVLKQFFRGSHFKELIIPNGVENFWIENKGSPKEYQNKGTLNFLYVGNFSKNKNLQSTINYLEKFASSNTKLSVTFNIIGGGNSGRNTLKLNRIQKELIQTKNIKINLIGQINNKAKLLNYYRDADFYIMLSKKETFGLTYLEAMSQGTPIIYTKGQGISSYFKDYEVGFSVDITKEISISIKINKLLEIYGKASTNCVGNISNFTWDESAKKIISTYKKSI